MASWKERGEVPDSDDEEEIVNQHNEQEGGVAEPAIDSPLNDLSKVFDLKHGLVNEEQDPQQNERRESKDAEQRPFGTSNKASPASNKPTTPLSRPRNAQSQLLSSPILLNIFKVPDLEGLLDEEVTPRDTINRKLQDNLPAGDDISTSYVRITSPSPILLSSPPASLPELPAFRASMNTKKSPASGFDEPSPAEQADENPEQKLGQEPSYPMRRALRQRNAIQLHPYVVEQEKYRQTLKSRGIAPMRLASSQVDQRPVAGFDSSPDRDFREEQETQEVEAVTGENQAMDFDWEIPSSPQRPAESRADDGMDRYGDQIEDQNDDDDELPDIEELLRLRPQISTQKETKKAPQRARMKSYSHKFKRPVLPRILTQSGPSIRPATRDHHVFDIPDSPPATSPQLSDVLSRRSGGMRSHEPSPSWLSQDELQMDADLPTPATSAMKPPPNPITIDSDSDDPFATDLEKSATSSSSDESVQIRNISKKFRGVLPASHLRLDQHKKQKTPNHTNRDSRSVSPVKSMPRRGIALPRTQTGTTRGHRSPSATKDTGFAFFSDESDEDELPNMIIQDDDISQLEDFFPESRRGYAEEDDRIDAMLPSHKRHGSSHRPSKKRKTGKTSFQRTESGAYQRQPKITEHLGKAPKSVSNGKSKSNRQHRSKAKRTATSPRRPLPPMLGILDVAEISDHGQKAPPDFIRIAARAARSRTTRGRHQPEGKFFKLSTREDTEDVQSVLQNWKAGKIQPKNLPSRNERPKQALRGPHSQIENNHQAHFESPVEKVGHSLRSDASVRSQKFRRLLVSRRQQSMNEFVRRDQAPVTLSRTSIRHESNNVSGQAPSRLPRFGNHSARPAQLEAAEKDYSNRYPSTTFKSSKRALDALYRTTRRRPTPSANLQLARFLADEDAVRRSIETSPEPICEASSRIAQSAITRPIAQKLGRQKPQPRRVDIGAAVYRQPSNPLILEHFAPEIIAGQSDKLQGLAKFGFRYTQHFDILPLPPGVFFQNSTFLGSGRLSKMVRIVPTHADINPVVISLNLANPFSWATWNENVSSEVGLCFDWLADQFERNDPSAPKVSEIAVINVVDGVLDYVQQSPSFDQPFNAKIFLSRMLEVIRDFSSRFSIKQVTSDMIRPAVKVLSRTCAVIFRLLLVARSEQECATLVFDFEDILKATAHLCVQLLLSEDMAALRKLYDDVQYLSYRERGIDDDQYAIEAWVILIKVLGEAKVPRGSFWDLVNPVLMASGISKVTDAPTLEKIWYSMYSLLPLCEFDEHGVVVSGTSQEAFFDNWQLPQQILKRIFSLYTSNPRQPPGFNEYCRSLVGRCHYLMVNWGWWNSSTVIGTLFDFFASHNLAHLRNEEVHTSPAFLDHLDENPPLTIETEDRSFHIFLKIVALALKHFTTARDFKTTRNLAARLQPNHDRQYPKEEGIHQRDLASLQNHHDLLCTLYWAAPIEQRPSITMVENIVQRGISHTEAFMVHIRSFLKLTKFSLSEIRDAKLYLLLKDWQDEDLLSLFEQSRKVENEARAEAAPGFTEAQIAGLVLRNQKQVERQIILALSVWAALVKAARNSEIAKAAFNHELLFKVLSFVKVYDRALASGVLQESLNVFRAYRLKVKEFLPVATLIDPAIHDPESQDSISERDWYMFDMTTVPLLDLLRIYLISLTRHLFQKEIDQSNEDAIRDLVLTTAQVLGLVCEAGSVGIGDFLITGAYAPFEDRVSNQNARRFWPHFLASLMKSSDVLRRSLPYRAINQRTFHVLPEWLSVLIEQHPNREFVVEFTTQMVIQFPILEGYVDPNATDLSNLRGTFRCMRQAMNDDLQYGQNRLRDEFGMWAEQVPAIFHILQGRMQNTLVRSRPGSEEHRYYMFFMRQVFEHILTYIGDDAKSLDFFVKASAYYTPHDVKVFGLKLAEYCGRLNNPAEGPQRLPRELFYFLYHSWHDALSNGSSVVTSYFSTIRHDAIKYRRFLFFLLEEFIPVCLQGSLETNMWPLFYQFLNAITGVLRGKLQELRKSRIQYRDQNRIFKAVQSILRIASHGLNTRDFQRGTFVVILYFWDEMRYPMWQWADGQTSKKPLQIWTDLHVYYHSLKTALTDNTLPPVGRRSGRAGCLDWNVLKRDGNLLTVQPADKEEVDVKGLTVCLPITWDQLLEVGLMAV